jgi:hypothetical protein
VVEEILELVPQLVVVQVKQGLAEDALSIDKAITAVVTDSDARGLFKQLIDERAREDREQVPDLCQVPESLRLLVRVSRLLLCHTP